MGGQFTSGGKSVSNDNWNDFNKPHPAHGNFKQLGFARGGTTNSILITYISGKQGIYKNRWGDNIKAYPYKLIVGYSPYSASMHKGSALNPNISISYHEKGTVRNDYDKEFQSYGGQGLSDISKKTSKYLKTKFGISFSDENINYANTFLRKQKKNIPHKIFKFK